MYSRSTDRGGRRIKLPPGYDGSAFRHDTGEMRRYGMETETKIHSPAEQGGAELWEEGEPIQRSIPEVLAEETDRTADNRVHDAERLPEVSWTETERRYTEEQDAEEHHADKQLMETPHVRDKEHDKGSMQGLLDGIGEMLGSEDLLLLLVMLLLLADGSDAWDVIFLLGLLLAVH